VVAAHGWHVSTAQIGPNRHFRLTDSQLTVEARI
jgi:hypothetical protein